MSPGSGEVRALRRYSGARATVTLLSVRRVHRGFFRILKGPTGGLLSSLALAAFLGGVAIAAPGTGPTPAADHRGEGGAVGIETALEHVADEAKVVLSEVRPASGMPPAFSEHSRAGGVSAEHAHGAGRPALPSVARADAAHASGAHGIGSSAAGSHGRPDDPGAPHDRRPTTLPPQANDRASDGGSPSSNAPGPAKESSGGASNSDHQAVGGSAEPRTANPHP